MYRMKFKLIPLTAVLLLFGGALIAKPDRYIPVCSDGIYLWAESVLPSLFPFMVIAFLLIKTGIAQYAAKPFGGLSEKIKLPKAAVPLFLISAFSGYPAGSRTVCEYYRQGLIDENDCRKLAPMCSTCGPLFALGTVGYKAFGGNGAGAKLLFACIFSVTSVSLIYCLLCKKPASFTPKAPKTIKGNALYDSFYGAVNAVCVAGAFICFFYTLTAVFADLHIFKPLEAAFSPLFGNEVAKGLCAGLCEATGGCFKLANAGGFFALPLAGFLITFGGVSIIAQQLCYLTECGVKPSFFIVMKLLQGLLAFGILCLIQ